MLDAVIKVGGSILSSKDTGSLNHDVFQGIAKQLAELYQRGYSFLVLTGVGYHGHYPVKTFELHKGFTGKPRDRLVGVNQTQLMVNELRNTLLQVLQEYSVPAFLFYASSMFVTHGNQVKSFNLEALQVMLEHGVIPVITGDLVTDLDQGDVKVLSADVIATYLSSVFKTRLLIHVTDVPGVFSKNPKVASDALFLPSLSSRDLQEGKIDFKQVDHSIDVSGGMWSKALEISRAVSMRHALQGVITGYSETILLDLVGKKVLEPSRDSKYTLIT